MPTLTRHSHGPEFLAKRDGRCPFCPEPIRRGEHYCVVVDRGVGTMHARCGRDYCRILDEYLDDDGAEGGEER